MAIILASTIAISTVPDDAIAATKPEVTKGALKIIISGLERDARPSVVITGPKFDRTIEGPTTLENLYPGRYTLRPKRVVESNGVERPAPQIVVNVDKGVKTVATANYYFVPNTTLTISRKETTAISGSITGPQSLVISRSPKRIVAGEILTSGPTISRPYGYILRVVSATSAGSETTVQAMPATLAEAIPDGFFNLEQLLKEVNSAFSSGALQSSNVRRSSLDSAHDAANYNLDCSGLGQINVVPTIGFSFTGANAEVSWDWLKTTGSVSIDYSVSTTLAVNATASADCSADIPLLKGVGATIVVDAGIPIALTPTYSVNLEGAADASGTFSQTLGESLGVRMAANLPPSFTSSVTPQSNESSVDIQESASIKLSLTASIGIEVDGVAGVSLDAEPGLNLTVEPTSSPWWTLQGCIDGGFTANILGSTVIDQSTALSWCTTLAKAKGGFPTESERVTQVNVGALQSCALLESGSAKCWGNNAYGELGIGSTTDSPTPATVSGLSNISRLATNTAQSCALLTTGEVQCWGHEIDDLDPITVGSGSTTPLLVIGVSGAVQVSVGAADACALLGNATVECWGENYLEQLGNGSTSNSSSPVTVTGVANVEQIASGGDTNCALLEGGTVKCWGSNHYGELGDGSSTPLSSTAVTVTGLSNVTQIAVGITGSCALLTSGSVKCWGLNDEGQLGNGSSTNSPTPVTVNGLSGVTMIAAGAISNCALLSTGSVKCWGDNTYGELGNGSNTNSLSPVTVSGLSGATQISAGNNHSCALLATGNVDCWGDNGSGELGNGSTANSSTPVSVEDI
jgi:alpha-tubulin suppressor-like RCC1 family protein